MKDADDVDEQEDEDQDDENTPLNSIGAFLKGSAAKNKLKPKAGAKGACNTAKASMQKQKLIDTFSKKVDTVSQVGSEENTEKAMKKVAIMHSITSKQLLEVKGLEAALGKTKVSVSSDFHKKMLEVKTKLMKQIDLLAKMVVSSCKVEAVKKALLQAAVASKPAQAFIQELQALKGK